MFLEYMFLIKHLYAKCEAAFMLHWFTFNLVKSIPNHECFPCVSRMYLLQSDAILCTSSVVVEKLCLQKNKM